MQKLNLQRTEVEVDIYGTVYKLRGPSVKENKVYRQGLDELKEDEQEARLLDFLERLGLPKKVSSEMEPRHILQIVESLMPNKKK